MTLPATLRFAEERDPESFSPVKHKGAAACQLQKGRTCLAMTTAAFTSSCQVNDYTRCLFFIGTIAFDHYTAWFPIDLLWSMDLLMPPFSDLPKSRLTTWSLLTDATLHELVSEKKHCAFREDRLVDHHSIDIGDWTGGSPHGCRSRPLCPVFAYLRSHAVVICRPSLFFFRPLGLALRPSRSCLCR